MTTPLDAKIAILGISTNPERYSWKAREKLLSAGYHKLQGIHPGLPVIDQVSVVANISDLDQPIHTLTVYIGAARLTPLIDEIIQLKPQRLILNPGTENAELIDRARANAIDVLEACTLVMLATGAF